MRAFSTTLLLLAALFVPTLASAQSVTFGAEIAFPGEGVVSTSAIGLNDKGQVVGSYGDERGGHGFLLDDGVYTSIDYPHSEQVYTSPAGINNAGDIVGSYWVPSEAKQYGFVYSRGEFTTLVAPFEGVRATVPQAINERGDIVGFYVDRSPILRAFLYRDGTFQQLAPPFPGAIDMRPSAMNARGTIVGSYFDTVQFRFPSFIYEDGEVTTLEAPDSRSTGALGVNDAGVISGTFARLLPDFSLERVGFIYEHGRFFEFTASALGFQPLSTSAQAINNRGTLLVEVTANDGAFIPRSFFATYRSH